MPSKDPVNQKANEWMAKEGIASSAQVKPSATTRTAIERRMMSAQVQRLARRLGADPDVLAKKIPADTLRRTKYPVLEQVHENGTRTFKHDAGIEESRQALVRR